MAGEDAGDAMGEDARPGTGDQGLKPISAYQRRDPLFPDQIYEIIPPWEVRSNEEWAEWLECPRFERHVTLPSTNDRAKALAREGAVPFTMVVADTQTAGRGRGGKPWYSPEGRGLWASVLLPRSPGGDPGIIPLMVGVAAARAIEVTVRRWAPVRTQWVRIALKWPNDIMLPSGKMGGVLCETVGGDAPCPIVAGVGLNLERPPGRLPYDLSYRARFLDEVAGTIPKPALAQALLDELKAWSEFEWDRLHGGLEDQWVRRDWLKERWVECEAGPVGRADGISTDGSLLVRTPDGRTESVRAGSVRVVDPPKSSESEPRSRPPAGAGEE